MAALFGELRRGAIIVACVVALGACASTPSYEVAAMEASDAGNQKRAVTLAGKEVERFSKPDQCSSSTNYNCGTLALAYGSLAGYQILDGDLAAGERSFRNAKQALSQTASENRSSATAMVYRDVSEAYWKVGDKARAVAVFKEGRDAGGDVYLFMTSAAKVADQPPPGPGQPGDGGAAETPDGRNTRNDNRPAAQSR